MSANIVIGTQWGDEGKGKVIDIPASRANVVVRYLGLQLHPGFEGGESERSMTYEEALQSIPCGRYRHFKGKPYEVIGIGRHSETEEPMVVYRALYGDGGLWARPADMWNETVERDGKIYRRFCRLDSGR